MPKERGNLFQRMVFVSVVLSPMLYLSYGHPELLIGGIHIYGFVFLFGSINPFSSFTISNPLSSLSSGSFLLLAAMWILAGIYLVTNTPSRVDRKISLIGHLLVLSLQSLVPFILFPEYLVIIPFPVPASIGILAMFEQRSREYSHLMESKK